MPSRSSFGESSLPVKEMPAEFHPALAPRSPPIVNTTGSPGTFHSIAIRWSSASGERSLVCPTSTWSFAVDGGTATRSLQRPIALAVAGSAGVRGGYQISSMEAAKKSRSGTPAASAAPSYSSASQGSAALVTSQ